MDYEKAYKESKSKMAEFLKKYDGFTISSDGIMYKELQNIFPELKESEDERIRKAVVKMLKVPRKEIFEVEGITKEQALIWLEKQKQVEWSEEDEKIKERLIIFFARISANTRTDSTSVNYTFSKEIDWLKSLRPQSHWRPSEEQLQHLKTAAEITEDEGYITSGHEVRKLIEQLKKL